MNHQTQPPNQRASRFSSPHGSPPGVATWPAYATAGATTSYGLLKAYWVMGGTALWDIAPLPPSLIEQARTHTAPTWFVITDNLPQHEQFA